MTHIELAKDVFGDNFDKMVLWTLQNGFMYSGDDAFGMVAPHSTDILVDKKDKNVVKANNCWLILYVSGDLLKLFDLLDGMDETYSTVVYERDDPASRHREGHKYKVYDLEKLKRRLRHGKR